MDNNDENSAIVKTVRHLFPDVEAVYVFGSHGAQTQHGESDIDIALLFPPQLAKTIQHPSLNQCGLALAEILNKPVDLINLRAENVVFQHEIIQNGRIIYKRSEYAVDEYEMLVISLYQKLNDERAGILQEIFQSGRIVAS